MPPVHLSSDRLLLRMGIRMLLASSRREADMTLVKTLVTQGTTMKAEDILSRLGACVDGMDLHPPL